MTLKELTDYQNNSGHICLMRQGLFFAATIRGGAVLLNSLFGYMVKRGDTLRCGRVYYVGFPASAADKVVERMIASVKGSSIVRRDVDYIEFTGVGVDYDTDKVEELIDRFLDCRSAHRKRKVKEIEHHDTVAAMILGVDVLHSTPLDALHLIAYLQQTITGSRRTGGSEVMRVGGRVRLAENEVL